MRSFRVFSVVTALQWIGVLFVGMAARYLLAVTQPPADQAALGHLALLAVAGIVLLVVAVLTAIVTPKLLPHGTEEAVSPTSDARITVRKLMSGVTALLTAAAFIAPFIAADTVGLSGEQVWAIACLLAAGGLSVIAYRYSRPADTAPKPQPAVESCAVVSHHRGRELEPVLVILHWFGSTLVTIAAIVDGASAFAVGVGALIVAILGVLALAVPAVAAIVEFGLGVFRGGHGPSVAQLARLKGVTREVVSHEVRSRFLQRGGRSLLGAIAVVWIVGGYVLLDLGMASVWVAVLLAAAGLSLLAVMRGWQGEKLVLYEQVLAERGRRPPKCFGCGYDLRGTPGESCPECGRKIAAFRKDA